MGNPNKKVVSSEFGRSDTKAMKGIAVVLMLLHHLAGFPDRVPYGFAGFSSLIPEFVNSGYLYSFAMTAKICVSIFFFLGGYGLYMRWKDAKLSVTGEIIKLFKVYWKVFVVFIPIAMLFFARSGEGINPLCTRYTFGGKAEMITVVLSDFLGLTCTLNPEWWFFGSYFCVIPMGYLFCRAIARNQDFWMDMLIVAGVDILIRSVLPAIANTGSFGILYNNFFFPSFFMMNEYASAYFAGIVLAKYDGICAIKKRLQNLSFPAVTSIVGLGILWWCRTFVIGEQADIIYCTLMIPLASVVLDRMDVIRKIFLLLGKNSTNMWLIHSFFCYYFLEVTHLVYASTNVWVDLVILIALTLAASMALDGGYTLLGKWNCSAKLKNRQSIS